LTELPEHKLRSDIMQQDSVAKNHAAAATSHVALHRAAGGKLLTQNSFSSHAILTKVMHLTNACAHWTNNRH
jgi:hypothetical protein